MGWLGRIDRVDWFNIPVPTLSYPYSFNVHLPTIWFSRPSLDFCACKCHFSPGKKLWFLLYQIESVFFLVSIWSGNDKNLSFLEQRKKRQSRYHLTKFQFFNNPKGPFSFSTSAQDNGQLADMCLKQRSHRWYRQPVKPSCKLCLRSNGNASLSSV